MQETKSTSILEGYSDQEKGAYLGAVASLATADRSASAEELEHLRNLAKAADLSEEQTAAIGRAATELSGDELKSFLDVLKTSNLRFSLVADLIAFAEVDNDYSEEERKNVQLITDYLGINKTQVSLLDQFVQRTSQSNAKPEEMAKPGFLDSLGLKDQFSNAGINVGALGKGLLSFLGPMILGGMLGRMSSGPRSRGGVGMPGSGMSSGGLGGFGSIISALGGRRTPGTSNSGLGGLLGNLLR